MMIIGDIFHGTYKIEGILGKGGMGTVYLAQNIKLGTFWAIKEISKKSNSKVDIKVEPNILKRLMHPALPRIFDIFEDEENIYIIVDYIEGESLDKKLQQNKKFSEKTVLDWACEICDVLHYLHSLKPNPIIYRDMKPSNIIITNEGRIKLIDFGIAREYKEGSDTDTVYIGTRGYAAPEQFGIGQSNERTDIYSLGVTLYHMMTGISPNQPPYELLPLRQVVPSLSQSMENIVVKCTKNDPMERYQRVEEIIGDLNKLKEIPTITSQKRDEITKPLVFKKLVFSFLGNSDAACELAYAISSLTQFEVLLINVDFIGSNVDLYLNLIPKMDQMIREAPQDFGLSCVVEAIKTNSHSGDKIRNASVRDDDIPNLFILTDVYDVKNIVKYEELDISSLIDCGYKNFDVTIVVLNDIITSKYSSIALDKSDYNIVAVEANVNAIRRFESYFCYMDEKEKIPISKTKFIAYEYKKDTSLPLNALKSFFNKDSFIGVISYSSEREKYRNLNGSYVHKALNIQKEEYLNILSQFNIVPKKTLTSKINNWLFGKKQ